MPRTPRPALRREPRRFGLGSLAGGGRMTATLLVLLDGSTSATAALSVARGLAHLKGATVALIHVGPQALAPDELLGRMRLSAEDARGLVIDQCTGSPADAIVREAA